MQKNFSQIGAILCELLVVLALIVRPLAVKRSSAE